MVGYHLWFLQLVVKLCFVQVLWTGSGERHWMQQFHSSIPGSRKSQEIPAPLLDAACDLFHCRTQRWACVSLPSPILQSSISALQPLPAFPEQQAPGYSLAAPAGLTQNLMGRRAAPSSSWLSELRNPEQQRHSCMSCLAPPWSPDVRLLESQKGVRKLCLCSVKWLALV